MPSATQAAAARGGGSQNLLHGSDLPDKMRQIQIKIVEAREAPEQFRSALILEFEELKAIPGKTAFALNSTNTQILAEMLGDNYDGWPGAIIMLTRVAQRNPQTNQATWGLAVTDARGYHSPKKAKGKTNRKPAKPPAKGKPAPASRKPAKAPKAVAGAVQKQYAATSSDVPF